MEYKECDCEGWKESMEQIIGAQTLSDIHNMPYTGRIFVYCPWCGRKREKKIDGYDDNLI